jgi:[acyl-carrier-protein] S-malonyltransferase
MEVVLLFSGQGAQKVGMGSDLISANPEFQAYFDLAEKTLGYSLQQVMFEGPMEELTRTSRCQPALYLQGLLLKQLLIEKLPQLKVKACAGLSLGEFTAHAAAGTYSFEEGLNLVYQRGAFMEEACLQTQGGMVAMLGGENEALQRLAAECDVDIANYNAPGQTVLSGSVTGVQLSAEKAKDFGVKRAIPLPVAGAYHSRLMMPAQQKLAGVLAASQMQKSDITVVANYSAQPVDSVETIRETLTQQVTGSVRWVESMQYFISLGYTTFIELGPDATLAGLMAKIDKSVRVISIKDIPSLEAAVSVLTT